MDPLLAIAAIRAAGSLISQLTSPAGPAVIQAPRAPRPTGPFAPGKAAGQFENLLRTEMKGKDEASAIKFADGVAEKMAARGIQLSQAQYESLIQAVEEAAAKGGNKALIMMNGYSFVADVQQRTILDAGDSAQVNGNTHSPIDMVIRAKT